MLAASAVRSAAVAREFGTAATHRGLQASLGALDPDDLAGAEQAVQALLASDAWASALIAPLLAGLAADPWFEPPLRVSRDGLRVGVLLFDCPAVSITASILSADALAALPALQSVIVPGRVSIVRYVRSGNARLRLWQAEAAGADFSAADAGRCTPHGTMQIADGMVLRLDGRTCAHLTDRAQSDIVMLTATIRAGGAAFAREYALPDGALVRVATLDDRASRTQMLLAFLRLAGRADAGDCFAAATIDGPFFQRWAAMREWLALDTAAALPRLRAMQQDSNLEIRIAAADTIRLVEQRMDTQQKADLCLA